MTVEILKEDRVNLVVFFAEAIFSYVKNNKQRLSKTDYDDVMLLQHRIVANKAISNTELDRLTSLIGLDIVNKCKSIAENRVGIGRFLRKAVDSGIRIDLED